MNPTDYFFVGGGPDGAQVAEFAIQGLDHFAAEKTAVGKSCLNDIF